MGRVTIGFGIFLILIGCVGFFLTYQPEKPPYTALIPAAFGLALAILGGLALKESFRKHAMHAAAMIGLVGFLGAAVMSLRKLLPALFSGEDIDRPNAVIAQLIMAATCLVFVGLCVKSFIDARRLRKQRMDDGGVRIEEDRG
jgi:Na+(H+)/acetate symporter ActP